MNKRQYCSGCDSNFYNGHNPHGIKQCWHFESARTVKRFAVGYWTPMDTAKNFEEVKTLSCHTESGKVSFLTDIPEHLRTEWRELQKERKAAVRGVVA